MVLKISPNPQLQSLYAGVSKDHSLISFDPTGEPIHGLDNVLAAYDWLVPNVSLSGPTSFAPAIYQAINLVKLSKGSYHILVIIADGQVLS